MNSSGNITVEGLAAKQRVGHSLDRAFYVDQSIFERDLQKVFSKQWLFVDHVSRIPAPGNYVTYEVSGESIVVVRGTDGQIHAHYNVCRHRGSRICLSGEGKLRTLTCPYHGWVYDLAGNLVHAKQMGEDFDRSQWGLHSCPVRVSAGLIFIFLGAAEDAPDFDEIEGDLLPFLKLHGLAQAKVAHTEVYPTPGNWKLAVENFRECYHCSVAHPQYTAVNEHVKVNDVQPYSWGRTRIPEWEKSMLEKGHEGYVIGEVGPKHGPQPYWAHRAPLQEGWQTASQDGKPVAPLMGAFKDFDGAETYLELMPQFAMSGYSDHVTQFRFTPLDPTHTEVRITWLVDQNAREGVDYDVERLKWLWDVTTLQDAEIIGNNQLGVNSRRYGPGPYSTREKRVTSFVAWYLDRLVTG
ncbi:aromatic ring-hydroxylating dioxygenase subunit alpha [Mesorhizobium sp. M0115]|uniref:aromatic ring-hydroxylating oxygenase subunit alpha n=1 Tax=Mesorhizobium sp. M0115 TaxID=2956883 RepID=UPI00333CEEAD